MLLAFLLPLPSFDLRIFGFAMASSLGDRPGPRTPRILVFSPSMQDFYSLWMSLVAMSQGPSSFSCLLVEEVATPHLHVESKGEPAFQRKAANKTTLR